MENNNKKNIKNKKIHLEQNLPFKTPPIKISNKPIIHKHYQPTIKKSIPFPIKYLKLYIKK